MKKEFLKEIVEFDLARAQGLIRQINDELDPQFRILTPEGDYWLAVTLPDDLSERTYLLTRISDFMALKLGFAFSLAAELHEPDSVMCMGVSRHQMVGGLSLIRRSPLGFAAFHWLDEKSLDGEIVKLLPPERSELDEKRLCEVERLFGPSGRFPALMIERIVSPDKRSLDK